MISVHETLELDLSPADAVRIVRERGHLMQEAVPTGVGGMAALMGLSAEAVAEVCAEAAQGEVVSPANLNGGGQIVVAGQCRRFPNRSLCTLSVTHQHENPVAYFL